LLWLNAHYLKALAPDALVAAARPFIAAAGLSVPGDDAWLTKALVTLQERARTLVELVEQGRYYFTDDVAIDPAAAAKFLKPDVRPMLHDLREALARLGEWSVPALTAELEQVIARHGVKLGKLAQPVRVAVTGGTASPGIFEVLEVLGRERTLARLDRALAAIG
jgi:glutamyl-tRNA synthetase